jgi:alpha-glucosidase
MVVEAWWQRAVIYQVYPRSFQDSNGDGVGDIDGMRRRLAYLAELGIDAVWISPIYPSPMADFGYDVSDYCDIDPLFGTLEAFDALVAEAHALGLRIILDFVPNHSSEHHPWFVESRSSRQSAKRDWYIWRDAAPDGGPPNNWLSNFGGSAWQWDEATRQYYYHAFLKEQPDLNWRNPEVQAAMHDALRFWLDRGVDGFRVDVIWHLMKDPAFRDNPPNPGYRDGNPEIGKLLQLYSTDQPDVHTVIAGMRRVLEEYDERVLIGEIYLPIERLVAYYGRDLDGAHLPFNFQLLSTQWDARRIAALIAEYEAALPRGGWPNWVLGNHDQPRIAARVGEAQSRVAAVLLLTLRGTPTMYYGDEIGMRRVLISREHVRDPWEQSEPGRGRDPQRTPMQWDASRYAGFSDGEPWLPLDPAHAKRNVVKLDADAGSILVLYQRLIALRRRHDALSIGAYVPREAGHDILMYERRHRDSRLLVVLNFAHARRHVDVEGIDGARLLLSTHDGRQGETLTGRLELRPDEAVILAHGPAGSAAMD